MKAEEKVKFLMRSFNQKVGVRVSYTQNFNIRDQLMFFARKDVKLYFHEVINDILIVKET